MRASGIVFLKEIRENLRDRRTVVNTLLTGPLLAPVLFVLMINAGLSRELAKAERPLPVPVVGAEHAPGLVEALERAGAEISPAPDDPERAVREQEADLVLRIPPDFAQAWRRGDPAQVELIHDRSHSDAQGQVARLQRMLQGYGATVSSLRLVARGIDPAVTAPLRVAGRDQSTAQSRGGRLFAMLPYFFVLGVFIGGMALAIDTTAGERERQSLEPLLATPVRRAGIVAGKLGATCVFAFTTLVLSILAFGAAGRFMPTEKMGIQLQLGFDFALPVLFTMLPLVVVLSSLQTIAAAFARSYREAQTYLSLLMFVPGVPTLLLAMLPLKTQTWMYGVPLMGQQVVMMRLLRGESVPASGLWLCFATSAVLAAVLYLVTTRLYRMERLAISA